MAERITRTAQKTVDLILTELARWEPGARFEILKIKRRTPGLVAHAHRLGRPFQPNHFLIGSIFGHGDLCRTSLQLWHLDDLRINKEGHTRGRTDIRMIMLPSWMEVDGLPPRFSPVRTIPYQESDDINF